MENTISITGIGPRELDELMGPYAKWDKNMIHVQPSGQRDPFSITSFLLQVGGSVLAELLIVLIHKVLERRNKRKVLITLKTGVELSIGKSSTKENPMLVKELMESILEKNEVSTIEIFE